METNSILKGEAAARECFATGNVIGAVKILRNENGITLLQAKDIVDQWRGADAAVSSTLVQDVRKSFLGLDREADRLMLLHRRACEENPAAALVIAPVLADMRKAAERLSELASVLS